MSLNARQRAFVEHYGVSGNATQAAMAAGYSQKTAAAIGSRLLRNANVGRALANLEVEKHTRLIADREERLTFLTSIMRDDTKNDATRLRAVELLAKINGDFRPKLDLRALDAWKVQTDAPWE